MNEKPTYYDGSVQLNDQPNGDAAINEPFQLTDEMRMSIGKNPFVVENNK